VQSSLLYVKSLVGTGVFHPIPAERDLKPILQIAVGVERERIRIVLAFPDKHPDITPHIPDVLPP
jgi:hypothetical protein